MRVCVWRGVVWKLERELFKQVVWNIRNVWCATCSLLWRGCEAHRKPVTENQLSQPSDCLSPLS